VTVTRWERLPLVIVTTTCTIDVEENVHESMEVPEPGMLLGVELHEVLLVLRLTTPVKPFRLVTVRLDVPAAPTFTLTLVGLAAIA
jgi:hypothetical protein